MRLLGQSTFDCCYYGSKIWMCILIPCDSFLRLISEVLGKDTGDKVPIEKVVMIIWQFRDDPQVVKFMTHFVAKVWQMGGTKQIVSNN